MKTGVLLTNLGTPDDPSTPAVRRYLREFLSDPRVVDLPAFARFLLVHGIILPFRGPKSARAYASIWGERGSPLLVHSIDLRDALRRELPETPIELGMRYGTPTLASSMAALDAQGCSRILCVPLYPQYASSSTGSTLQALYEIAGKRSNTPMLEVLPPFHSDQRFLAAQAALIRATRESFEPDHVLLSFHGLPERHCAEGPQSAHCLKSEDCCDALLDINRDCYRAQCFATARGLRERLGLSSAECTLAFQSRLGRRPWIQPHTDVSIPELARRGVRRLAVSCPSFTADCLETVEEIGIRAAADFRAAGGEELRLIPALNASPAWTRGLAEMVGDRLQ